MYYAKIDDYFVNNDAIFYHLSEKLDMAPILQNRLNNSEKIEEAIARWSIEQHWLADWNHKNCFKGYHKNCTVAFDIKSSTYYHTMKHKNKRLENVRSINVSVIEKCE